MKPGKLPLENLNQLIKEIPIHDPRVIVGPSLGEDAAIVDMGEQYLVAKNDQITFPTSEIHVAKIYVFPRSRAPHSHVPIKMIDLINIWEKKNLIKKHIKNIYHILILIILREWK